jgi:hypothetical protein
MFKIKFKGSNPEPNMSKNLGQSFGRTGGVRKHKQTQKKNISGFLPGPLEAKKIQSKIRRDI